MDDREYELSDIPVHELIDELRNRRISDIEINQLVELIGIDEFLSAASNNDLIEEINDRDLGQVDRDRLLNALGYDDEAEPQRNLIESMKEELFNTNHDKFTLEQFEEFLKKI